MSRVLDRDPPKACDAGEVGGSDEPQRQDSQRGELTATEMALTTVGGFAGAAVVLQWLIPICLAC